MTSNTLSRRLALAAALSVSLWLGACGGGSSSKDGNATVRAINLSDIASADLYAGDTRQFTALAKDALAPSINLGANTYTLNLKMSGDTATLVSGSYPLSKDKNYTVVIWGRESGPRLATLSEDENSNEIAVGSARVRVLNATTDSGSLDVFLTAPTTDLGGISPTQGALTSGTLSGFRDIGKGSYRLRVTGVGEPDDVRLDIPTITLGEKEFSTLVITAGASGVLVNGTLILQRGAAAPAKNTKARVRLVAGVDSGGNVAATLGAATLAGSVRSPSVGPYTLIDAGDNLDLTLRVNGGVAASSRRSFVAGSDYTLLAHGAVGAGAVEVIVDDNRLPTSATRTKVRLVNGVQGAGPMTLSVDLLAVAADVAVGAASPFATISSNASASVDVTSSAAAAPLYRVNDVNLQGQAVYTVFLLGGNAVPTGVIRKER